MEYRKGQLAADFYVALIIFTGFLAYITFQLFQIVPASSSNLDTESARIEAYQLSELLVNDGGYPSDWHDTTKYPSVTDIKRIGLSDSTKDITNYLSSPKITRFKSLCSNFNDIKALLDITDEAGFTIIEHRPAGDDVFNSCKSAQAKKESFSVSRTVFIDGTSYPTEIIAEVWKR